MLDFCAFRRVLTSLLYLGLIPVVYALPGPHTIFKTEPTFAPIKVEINHHTDDLQAIQPGFVFIAPHLRSHGWGPHIFDRDGELVWYGQDTVTKCHRKHCYAMNFHVCDYLGESGTHLCYSEARHEGRDQGIRSAGANRIFNASYQQVGPDYVIASHFTYPNPHEFNMFPGGRSFGQAVYRVRKYDLSPYLGSKSGWVFEGCFQEVDVQSADEIFRWCVLDHEPIWMTDIYLQINANKVNLSTAVGGKGTKEQAWDFMHLNAIDKNEEGDYIVSGRHLDQIAKVAGLDNKLGKNPGDFVWRLGGKATDFKASDNASFSRQHHVRFLKTTANETVISVFDNAWEGHTPPSSQFSSAKVLVVNNQTWEVSAERVYKHPKGLLAYAQGSVQILENENVYVGWGALPEWSEFAKDGTLLSHGRAVADTEHLENYRTFKHNWVGRPNTKPKVVVYCKTCTITSMDGESPLVAYVSWNGATEVHSWRFFIGATRQGPWIDVGVFDKKGFETKVPLYSTVAEKFAFVKYVKVDALDASGKVLESSAATKTFVPKRSIQDDCEVDGCYKPRRFKYTESLSHADLCDISWFSQLPALIMLALVCLSIEAFDSYLVQKPVQHMLNSPTLQLKGGYGILS